ncbi:hypothetical protein ES703_91025 [subsurface metagenome]
MACAKNLLHFRPTQVEISAGQAKLLGSLFGVVNFERRGLRGIEDFNLLHGDFDLAGRQLRIFQSFTSRLNNSFCSHYPFAAGRPCQLVDVRLSFGIENQLGQALFVTQVDEYQIAVVAIGMDPAGQRDLFAGGLKTKLPAIVCSFQHCKNLSKKS